MSEPPGPRDHSPQPEEPLQPGQGQPPPSSGYQPPSGESEYRPGPQPRNEYDQRRPPQPEYDQHRPAPPEYPQRPQPRGEYDERRPPRPEYDQRRQSGYPQGPQSEIEYQQRSQPQTGYGQQLHQGYQQQPPYGARQPYTVHRASEETTRDAQAALAARMELGPEYTEHVAEGLAERVEQLAAIRAGELRHEAEVANSTGRSDQSGRVRQFVLGIVSLTVGIPITAIAATNTDPGLLGVAVSWLGIVGVNAVHARANRPRE